MPAHDCSARIVCFSFCQRGHRPALTCWCHNGSCLCITSVIFVFCIVFELIVTHSEWKGTRLLGRSRKLITRENTVYGSFLSIHCFCFFVVVHIDCHLFYHVRTADSPFRFLNDIKIHFKWQESRSVWLKQCKSFSFSFWNCPCTLLPPYFTRP